MQCLKGADANEGFREAFMINQICLDIAGRSSYNKTKNDES